MKKKKKRKQSKLLYFISDIRIITIIIFLAVFFVLGEIFYVLTKSNIALFHVKHVIMYCICFLGLYTSLMFARKLKSIQIDATTEPVISIPIAKMVRLCYSPIAIITGIIAGSSYLLIFIVLQFVPIDFVGVYCLILAAIDISLAAILLIQYMILVVFIFIISKKNIKKHHNYDVSRTTWLVELFSLANLSKNVFFVLVSFMVIMFISFIPFNFVELIITQKTLYSGFFPTIIYFLSVAVYDLIVLPIMSIVQNHSFRIIVSKINNDIIKDYEHDLMKASTKQSYKYLIPIEYINSMSKQFLENRRGKFIPAISYMFNATSIFVTIASGVKDLF